MDKKEFTEIMKYIGLRWPMQQQIPTESYPVLLDTMKEYDGKETLEIVKAMSKKRKWRPDISEIIEVLEGNKAEIDSAFDYLLTMVYNNGKDQTEERLQVIMIPEIFDIVGRLGGWRNLWSFESQEQLKNRFVEEYKSKSDQCHKYFGIEQKNTDKEEDVDG
jgi:hypothetical protein